MSKNLAILIIEDDLVDQMAFSRALSKHFNSAKIIISENIHEAIVQMQKQNFDWVISDYNLPDGTVMDILQFAKANKMVCLSGETEEAKIQFLLNQGIKKFFLKDQHLNYLTNLVELIKNPEQKIITNDLNVRTPLSLDFLLEKFDGEKAVVKDILDIFTTHGPSDLEELQIAILEKNTKACQNTAHRIKSGYRVLGLNQAVQFLETIETGVLESDVDWYDLEKKMKQIKSIFQFNAEIIPTLISNYSLNA